jgi:hypothetical protein
MHPHGRDPIMLLHSPCGKPTDAGNCVRGRDHSGECDPSFEATMKAIEEMKKLAKERGGPVLYTKQHRLTEKHPSEPTHDAAPPRFNEAHALGYLHMIGKVNIIKDKDDGIEVCPFCREETCRCF